MLELLENLLEKDFKDTFKSVGDKELDKRFGKVKDWTVYNVVISGNRSFPYGGDIGYVKSRTPIQAVDLFLFKIDDDAVEIGEYKEYLPGVWANTPLFDLDMIVITAGKIDEEDMAQYAKSIWFDA